MAARRGTKVHINTENNHDYNKIKAAIESRGLNYNEHRPKQDRTKRFIVRKLIPTTDVDDLRAEIEGSGFKVAQVFWKPKPLHKQSEGNKHYELVVVELEDHGRASRFLATKHLLHQKVIVEEEHYKGPPVCKRCQQYDHAHNQCHNEPVCGVCGQGHLSTACGVAGQNPKCVRCGEEGHRPTFKGCKKYQEFLARRTQTKTSTTPGNTTSAQPPHTSVWELRAQARAQNQMQHTGVITVEQVAQAVHSAQVTSGQVVQPNQAVQSNVTQEPTNTGKEQEQQGDEESEFNLTSLLTIFKKLIAIFKTFKSKGLMAAIEQLIALAEKEKWL